MGTALSLTTLAPRCGAFGFEQAYTCRSSHIIPYGGKEYAMSSQLRVCLSYAMRQVLEALTNPARGNGDCTSRTPLPETSRSIRPKGFESRNRHRQYQRADVSRSFFLLPEGCINRIPNQNKFFQGARWSTKDVDTGCIFSCHSVNASQETTSTSFTGHEDLLLRGLVEFEV